MANWWDDDPIAETAPAEMPTTNIYGQPIEGNPLMPEVAGEPPTATAVAPAKGWWEDDPIVGEDGDSPFKDRQRDLVHRSLKRFGASDVATAALLGDIEQESSFNPTLSDDGGTSHGLFQTGTPMYRQYNQEQARNGIKPGTDAYLYNQAPFVISRFQEQHPDRWEAMQNAPDAPTALDIFRSTPDWGYGIAGKRHDYANAYQQAIQNFTATAPLIAGAPTGASVQAGQDRWWDSDPNVEEAEATPEGGGGFLERMRAMFAPTPEAVAYGQQQFSATPEQLEALPAEMAAQAAAQDQAIREHREPLPVVPGEENLTEPPFVTGAGEKLGELVPRSWGQAGQIVKGMTMPFLESPHRIRQAYDVISGVPTEEAIPESVPLKRLEEIKQKYGGDSPEYQKAAGEAAGTFLPQVIMAAFAAKGLSPEIPSPTGITVPERVAPFTRPEPLPEAIARQREAQLRAAVKGPEEPVSVEPTTIGEPYARPITEAEGLPSPQIRPGVDEEAPLRQPGETPAIRRKEEVPGGGAAPEAQAAVAPEPIIPPEEARYTREGAPPPEPVAEPGKASTDEGGISIKNEYTEAQRQALGFPEAVQEARRDFGTVWEEAEATDRRDPGAKGRLVDEINEGKVKALDDHGDALLLREQIRAQGERNAAAKAVNEAVTDADRTAAKSRLQIARDELQSVYDADKKAGRSTAQGLNARKMLAKEDYSLTAMEARKRAANNGERLSEEQLRHTEALHAEITELSDRINQLEAMRPRGKADFNRLIREGQKEAKSAAAAKKRFTDFTGEKAAKARERVAQRRREGRLYSGVDPVAVADHVIIGADYLAKGVTKFSDWSAAMVKELGEKIKPFLNDLWKKSRNYHDKTAKAYRTPAERAEATSKTRMAGQMIGLKAKIERGDFTKPTREQRALSASEYKMKGNLQKLKNEFEKGVARDAFKKMSPADKFWQHFVGVERGWKLSSPAVFEKLGLAAAVREVLAPLEAGGGYAVSKVFPRLAKGTRYGAGLGTIGRAEIKAKAALFTEGMKDAWENLKGKETELEAISDKYGRQPDFWYNRIGKIHAAVKAPVKRAEFVRSLEHRMDAAVKAGEDINHPQVMDRLATESAMDANRAIFQQNTVVSKFFAMLDKLTPAGGRTARFLFPVVKIPVNLFKELVTYNVGGPVAAAKIGRAYWKGVETLEPAAREAIIRQLTKGSVGGAALLWGYFNSDKVHDFFASMPPFFQHTPVAMAIHEGSIIGEFKEGSKEAGKDLQKMAKYDIPFMYTITGATDALNPRNPHGWRDYIYSMIQSTTIPQAASWAAKELDKPTPFSLTDKPAFRQPANIIEAVTQGIPGLRGQVPLKGQGPKSITALMRERMLTR